MRLREFLFVGVVLVLLLTGCGSKSEKVQGVWKEKEAKKSSTPVFVEIGKNYIVINGERKDGIVLTDVDDVVMVQESGTRKDLIRLILVADDTLIIEVPILGKGTFVRSTKAEMEAVAKAKAEAEAAESARQEAEQQARAQRAEAERKAREQQEEAERLAKEKKRQEDIARNKELAIQAQGLWVEDDKGDDYLNEEYKVIEIGNGTLEYEGKKGKFTLSDWEYSTSKGEDLYLAYSFADKPESRLFAVRGFEDAGKIMLVYDSIGGWGAREKRYRRITRDEITRHDKPNFADIKGFWVREGGTDEVFKVIAFSDGLWYCDGQRISVEVETKEGSPQLNFLPKNNRSFAQSYLLTVVYLKPGVIAVRYGSRQPWYTYTSMDKEAAKQALATYKNKVKLVEGYWKSEKPFDKDEYAYLVVKLGQKDDKKTEDVVYALHTDGYKNAIVMSRGILNYYQGKVGGKLWIISNSGGSDYPGVEIINENTLACDLNRDAKGIRFVRISKDEVPAKLLNKAE